MAYHRGGSNGNGNMDGNGKNAMGRNGYRQRPQEPTSEHRVLRSGGFTENGSNGYTNGTRGDNKDYYASPSSGAANGTSNGTNGRASGDGQIPSPSVAISSLEKKIAGVQQEFTQALHKIGEKENEKFDLIFAILSELQSRQAELEESVRTLKAQYGGSGTVNGRASSQGSQMNRQAQQSYGNGMGSQMNGNMGGGMGGQQMGQFTGMMSPDGQQTLFAAVPQMVVVQSPTGSGMQYGMPQMMSPNGNMQMAPQMMQYMGQDMGCGGCGQLPVSDQLQGTISSDSMPDQRVSGSAATAPASDSGAVAESGAGVSGGTEATDASADQEEEPSSPETVPAEEDNKNGTQDAAVGTNITAEEDATKSKNEASSGKKSEQDDNDKSWFSLPIKVVLLAVVLSCVAFYVLWDKPVVRKALGRQTAEPETAGQKTHEEDMRAQASLHHLRAMALDDSHAEENEKSGKGEGEEEEDKEDADEEHHEDADDEQKLPPTTAEQGNDLDAAAAAKK